ncbi:lasso peptide biosynthesis PqqD family chaperone [Paenibacillus sinopodophylli]|uniref:lasso peptide biosynthesis PqqD family chaperone n=1 Tax=Paenibacillus sinopodophylli TaxID=1837342 RepID=UPI00110CB86E|nr:lasso peptide biosynthesis PqqD family chaperone [Paenibacillus sinopodophylli]
MLHTETIQLSDLIMSCEQNIVSDMGGEKVMLSIRNGNYYNLGTTGGRIWDLLSENISAQQIVEQLLSEYDVDQRECEQQVISFLEQMRKEGLVLVAEKT